ncbi:hypothetical protein E2562_015871 [Oryza meyeriana var. granulata]|uniref:Uncharacterized protein n=1 Tax=Oryza meyeriana var. granulata TaxID=110450 RepID=A0A6G1D4U9_9ORYZ|nr:hypothetical protein E2562_015871 [Oryza meyeriana var. granulata]
MPCRTASKSACPSKLDVDGLGRRRGLYTRRRHLEFFFQLRRNALSDIHRTRILGDNDDRSGRRNWKHLWQGNRSAGTMEKKSQITIETT